MAQVPIVGFAKTNAHTVEKQHYDTTMVKRTVVSLTMDMVETKEMYPKGK